MRKSELYFEEIGDDFDRMMSDYDVSRRRALISRLIESISTSGTALEVGCGTGAITPVLLNKGLDITVGDISLKLAEETAKKFGLKASMCDATQIQFDNNSFNLVMSSEVIEHVPSPKKALGEMARVVAPGGYLIVTSPNKLWYPVLLLSQKLNLRGFAGNEQWLWPTEAAATLKQEGLEVIKITGCHLFPWQIPMAKKILPFLDKLGDILWPFTINWGILCRKPS